MTALGWDTGNIYTTNIYEKDNVDNSPAELERQFLVFIEDFHIENEHFYSNRLAENFAAKNYFLEVFMDHLRAHNENIALKLENTPGELLSLFELAAKAYLKRINPNDSVPEIQIILRSSTGMVNIRDLNANYISKLVRIHGIIISAVTLTARAKSVQIRCKTCQHSKKIFVKAGFSGAQIPRVCDSDPTDAGPKQCGLDPFILEHDKSLFADQQVLKIQEAPDMVPVGDLPRHIILCTDRYLAGVVLPGQRITVMGIYDVYQTKSGKGKAVAVRNTYINVVGLEIDNDHNQFGQRTWESQEEEEFIAMSKKPDIHNYFSNNIAPSIFGNKDIKKAIACLLFSGSKKIMPDGLKIRGDINVLLLGDPGTAKSQLLKFVEKVAPVSVYTSGKGSSAAGLTASVIRDPATREFYLEGGAMVLADGGVVCIDEFDKMRDEDRVAIHEAMEQQTISIAKAGITTVMNSRTSVLAAANPIFGRYDDMKTPGENIDFQATILSRFDMIFLVKDEHNEQRDRELARHVMMVHINRATPQTAEGDIDITKMKRYISYCKSKCAPRLTETAANLLASEYVRIRAEVGRVEHDSNKRSSIPITIRQGLKQLEAIIRIAEALAKMCLSPEANEVHVREAIQLFKKSTVNALQNDQVNGLSHPDLMSRVQNAEKWIKKRLPVGSQVSSQRLIEDLIKEDAECSDLIARKAIDILVRRDVLQYVQQRKKLVRVGDVYLRKFLIRFFAVREDLPFNEKRNTPSARPFTLKAKGITFPPSLEAYYNVSRIITLGRAIPEILAIQQNLKLSHTLITNIPSQSFRCFISTYHSLKAEGRRQCWKCHSELDYFSLHCGRVDCGIIQQNLPSDVNYFQLLGVEKGPEEKKGSFEIDLAVLRHNFLVLQRQVHPDRYSQKDSVSLGPELLANANFIILMTKVQMSSIRLFLSSIEEKEYIYATNLSSMINEAYQVLRDPLARAQYMLRLNNIFIAETQSIVDTEILMEVMEFQECLEEELTEEQLKVKREETEAQINSTITGLSQAFQKNDLDKAKCLTIKLQMWYNIKKAVINSVPGKRVELEH
ncbi:hypothetical protein G9A89_003931 [Geosiphon pyriformis]|nr:hypothetical protein G9A89_003931 [Geosiphon pyriformis]